ncbi:MULTISPECIES: hypothetical protein [Saccharibacillus]|nr:hypothetical protein [Saccharibacillus sp. WB 17]MWJ32206.1 hypothetical protein [Saccharibacillus sp. WB 17]
MARSMRRRSGRRSGNNDGKWAFVEILVEVLLAFPRLIFLLFRALLSFLN